MEITYHGANCLRLSAKGISLLVDPSAGTKTQADVLLYSVPAAAPPTDAFIIDGPGEYEIKGALVTGIPARQHVDEQAACTIYLAQLDGVSVAVLPNIGPKLSDSQLEELGQVDVLAVPVGGHGLTLDAAGAVEIVSQVEPKYVIPTHYDDGKTKYPAPQEKLDPFLNEIGSRPEPVAKLRVTPAELPLETTLVVLKPD